jgi:hypothetical protein
MTVPNERTQAVIYTEQFLKDLLDPKKTPRVPRAIRQRAGRLLRHYPGEFYMNIIADREDAAEPYSLSIKVFGKSWS